MKMLIYVEPHPVRDIKHFSNVARKFIPLLKSENQVDARLFGNKATLDTISDQIKDQILWPTDAENAMFQAFDNDWEVAGLYDWVDLMSGQQKISEHYENLIRRLWSRFPFDVLVHWGENGAVNRFVKTHPVGRISMELGCTRSPFLNSVVMDPYGSNGKALIGRLTVNDLKNAVGNESISREKSLFGFSENLEASSYSQQFAPLPESLNDCFRNNKLVFMPLQLFDDANLLVFSKYNSLVEVVLDVVPRLVEHGYTVIVKPHPGSKHRKGAKLANSLARSALSPWSNGVIWDEGLVNIPNSRYFSIAEIVVTVNSSVGFEALYYDKPVVVLGDAVYKPLDLFPSLGDLLANRFDEEQYVKNICALRTFMFGCYLLPSGIFDDVSSFVGKVALIKRTFGRHQLSPNEYAKQLFNGSYHSSIEQIDSKVRGGITGPKIYEFAEASVNLGTLCGTSSSSDNSIIEAESKVFMSMTKRLIRRSQQKDLDGFVTWLSESWDDQSQRACLISSSDLLDEEYYEARYVDIKEAKVSATQHYSTRGILESRSPRKEVGRYSVEKILECLVCAAKSEYELIHRRSLAIKPLSVRSKQLQSIENSLSGSSSRVLVIMHLYYKNLVPEILQRLHEMPDCFDLIVTTPAWGFKEIVSAVHSQFPEAIFYHAENRGRDIAPFLDLLPVVLKQDYRAVLKIQTKNGYYQGGRLNNGYGQIWRRQTLDSLIGSSARIEQILNAFDSDKNLNLVGPEPFLQSIGRYPYHDKGELASSFLEQDGDSAGQFFAGTMFWFRPECFRCLQELDMLDFDVETGNNDGAFAHLVERLFGHVATTLNGSIASAPVLVDEQLILDAKASTTSIHDYLVTQSKLITAHNYSTSGSKSRALFW